MEVGVDPAEIAAASEALGSAMGPFLWIMGLLAAGLIGRMIFVAWGDRLRPSAWLQNMSGAGLIALALGLFVVGIFVSGTEVRAWVKIQQSLIDPFLVTVLKRDSCNPTNDRFCVVVWEQDGREIMVKWHDRRVNAHKVFGGHQFTLYSSARPQPRPTGR